MLPLLKAGDAVFTMHESFTLALLCRLTPCEHELTAILQRITQEQAIHPVAGGIIFLLDGSGSVSQGVCCKQQSFMKHLTVLAR